MTPVTNKTIGFFNQAAPLNTGALLREQQELFTSENNQYCVKANPYTESYAVINNSTGFCEAESVNIVQAFILAKRFESLLIDFMAQPIPKKGQLYALPVKGEGDDAASQ